MRQPCLTPYRQQLFPVPFLAWIPFSGEPLTWVPIIDLGVPSLGYPERDTLHTRAPSSPGCPSPGCLSSVSHLSAPHLGAPLPGYPVIWVAFSPVLSLFSSLKRACLPASTADVWTTEGKRVWAVRMSLVPRDERRIYIQCPFPGPPLFTPILCGLG